MQQLPTPLAPAVHPGKETTYKTLETMCIARVWPQQCWKSSANGSNIFALRLGDHGTKEMLGGTVSKVLRNNTQQFQTVCANGRLGDHGTKEMLGGIVSKA